MTATTEKVNTILCLCMHSITFSPLILNLGDHSEKSSSSICDVQDPPPQSAAQLEKDEDTCTDSDSDSDDEEKLEEELIFMDLVSMNIVDLC